VNRCVSCRFFWPATNRDDDTGVCRRYPPVPLSATNDEDVVIAWPIVAADDFCGEQRNLAFPRTVPSDD